MAKYIHSLFHEFINYEFTNFFNANGYLLFTLTENIRINKKILKYSYLVTRNS